MVDKLICANLSILLLSLTSTCFAQGAEKYIPTKIEWATMALNSECGWNDPGMAIIFSAATDSEIVIRFIHDKNALRVVVDSMELNAVKCFESFKEAKGWSWLRYTVKRPK